MQNSQKKETIEEEFEIGKDIDIHIKYETLDNGSIKMLAEIDAKTEEAEKFLKNNPNFIKKTLLKSMPLLMRFRFKLRFLFQKDIDFSETHNEKKEAINWANMMKKFAKTANI